MRGNDNGSNQWVPPPAGGRPRGLRTGEIVGLAGLALFLLPGLAGWPYAALFGSLYLAVALLWHVLRGRSWLNRFVPGLDRRRAALGLPLAFAVFVAGAIGLPTPPPAAVPAAPAASPVSTPVETPSPEPSPAPSVALAVGPAADALATLVVRDAAPADGYVREAFGQPWADVDRNGCDTRNDVLRRDLAGFTVKPGTGGCAVLAGTVLDRYTGTRFDYDAALGPDAVHVDHLVSLHNAWVSGAHLWPAAGREAFANDPLNLMVTGSTINLIKSERDAAGWLPPDAAFACQYVAHQVAVKAKYQLSVTRAEAEGIRGVLATCSGQVLPVEAPIPLAVEPAPSTSTLPPAPPPAATAPAPAPVPVPLQSGATSTTTRTTTTSKPATTRTTTRTTTTSRPATTTSKPVGGCVIKGNISNKGEKIYHVRGGQFYDVTKIDLGKGERWFCSESEARAAGWRASQR